MDSGDVLVLVLILAAAVFLVFAERNSRRNVANLKAGSVAKAETDQQSQQSLDANRRQESTKAKSS
jgi:hypothetical protein